MDRAWENKGGHRGDEKEGQEHVKGITALIIIELKKGPAL